MTDLSTPAAPESACAAFAEELKRLRNERGLAQSELARRLNIKPPYLCAVERLHRPAPGGGFIERMCIALELDEQEACALRNAATGARAGWKQMLHMRKAKVKPKFLANPTTVEVVVNGVRFVVPSLPETPQNSIQIVYTLNPC
ncbi:MAG: helix-turn-helix transcriptional regulator [Pseudomonadota bacterium]